MSALNPFFYTQNEKNRPFEWFCSHAIIASIFNLMLVSLVTAAATTHKPLLHSLFNKPLIDEADDAAGKRHTGDVSLAQCIK